MNQKKEIKQGQRKQPILAKIDKSQRAKSSVTSKSQAHSDDVRRDQKLQAILLADSFTTTFRPITLQSPKVLLPLVNVPMIDYTIEFLTQNGIEEIIVFCGWFAEKLEEYLNKSRWINIVSIKCISSHTCTSAGDALREMDAMNIIRSDPFILISGDVIANINLKKAIAFHQSKRKEDPNNIMTLALKKVQRCGGSKPLYDDLIVGMHKASSQIIIFADNMKHTSVSLPIELMGTTKEVIFKSDLLDCNVDICSPELLLQFSDNYDYQDIRKDFIQNEVCNYSLGKHIYGYVIENEYAARVQDPRTYHSISRDIVTRWTYPLVPDVPLLKESQYSQSKRYVYRDVNVKISRTAEIVEETVIGRGTIIGEEVFISRTIIGERVSIGSCSRISDSHIWKECVIGSNVRIEHAIICDNVCVEDGCTIPMGCIISFGVRLSAGTILKPYTRITVDQSCFGKCSEWTYDQGIDGEISPDFVKHCSMGTPELWKRLSWMNAPLPLDDESDDEAEDPSEFTNDQDFTRIVSDMVISALQECHPVESVIMEIKGFKFAQNKSFGECLEGIVHAICNFLIQECEVINIANFFRRLRELTKEGQLTNGLIRALTHHQNDEGDIIGAFEDFLLGADLSLKLPAGLRFFLQVFHESGLLSDEGIFEWAASRTDEENSEERMKLFRDPMVQEFIEWLKDEDDSDSNDDSDDSQSHDDSS